MWQNGLCIMDNRSWSCNKIICYGYDLNGSNGRRKEILMGYFPHAPIVGFHSYVKIFFRKPGGVCDPFIFLSPKIWSFSKNLSGPNQLGEPNQKW